MSDSGSMKIMFAPRKLSRRGQHLIRTGAQSKLAKSRRRYERIITESTSVSEASTFPEQELSETTFEVSEISKITATPTKRRRVEAFPEEDDDFSLIVKGFSVSDSPLPSLQTESHRPIGHPDPNIGNLKGRRIIDIGHIISEARKLENHECVKRPPGYFSFSKEENVGLNSYLYFKCTRCAECRTIVTNPESSQKENINFAAVWGTIAVGKGFYGMEEFLSTMNIPVMTSKTFRKYHNEVGETWFESLTTAIADAASKEYSHALELGNMDGDIAKIEVCVDGGWSQRSYNHSYTAKSGVAVIIGRHTKNLLHLGVRNKYCSICAIAARKGETPKEHACFNNWTGSSPAMEADIIVDGFKNSEAQFKLRYVSYVGDGDSSVRKKIEEAVPYSNEITKIDCINHLLKNIKKHLYKLAQENAAQKKTINDKVINSITKYSRKLVTFYGNLPQASVTALKTDLSNVVNHSFGEHKSCQQEVCTEAGSSCTNEAYQRLSGTVKARIGTIVGTLAAKADSLMKNATSNAAEEFMHIACKFNGGKQIFYGRRNSYNIRCYGAGLAYQYGPEWSNKVWKQYTGRSPGTPTKKMVVRRQKSIALSRQYVRRFRHSRYIPQVTTSKSSGRKDYGPNSQQPDLPQEEVEALIKAQIQRLNVTNEEQDDIEIKTRGQYLNPIWLQERELRLTAANFGAVCKRRAAPGPLVSSILFRRIISSDAMEWGKLNEKVAIEEYEKVTGMKVQECGLFVCSTPGLGYLAASPDGIIDKNKIVEVKCPYTARFLEPTEAAGKIKQFCSSFVDGHLQLKRGHNYYYQIQGQLFISGRKSCDFIIWTTKGINIQNIIFDKKFVQEMFPKLEKFYLEQLGPEIVDSRKKRSLDIRNSSA